MNDTQWLEFCGEQLAKLRTKLEINDEPSPHMSEDRKDYIDYLKKSINWYESQITIYGVAS